MALLLNTSIGALAGLLDIMWCVGANFSLMSILQSVWREC